jgi:hypothetical protein
LFKESANSSFRKKGPIRSTGRLAAEVGIVRMSTARLQGHHKM